MIRPLLFLLCLFSTAALPALSNGCLQCHPQQSSGFTEGHAFGPAHCVACHAGDQRADTLASAHSGLRAFPGNLDNAALACGSCHADKVAGIDDNLMHTGRGIVETTRRLIDDSPSPHGADLQSLGHGVADSMLRKLCAGCHLGQPKTAHRLDPTADRGGGCLACHINERPEGSHPTLSRRVSDARCFGCHSRSGRISLSYAGLAETMAPGELRLADGRRVERRPADVHHLAGMSCIDCHTGVELMGPAGAARHQRDAVDISCVDCHQVAQETPQTRNRGTQLPHIEVREDGTWLHSKLGGRSLLIPQLNAGHSAHTAGHERLECATCHSQWAPQCFGCHMQYDADGVQWDHVERAVTAGRWTERRWDIRNGLPSLGVNHSGKIDIFVPGMIMSISHPLWEEEKQLRVFAPLSPHTTGKARSCESCHRSSGALGLGKGEILRCDGRSQFVAAKPSLADGLPADAWTNLAGGLGGATPRQGQRPLSREEMENVLSVHMPGDRREPQQPSSAAGGGSATSSSAGSENTGGTKGAGAPAADCATPERSPTK